MATNHTQNYQLNLWEAQDTFLRTEFNENSQKLDAALKAEADARAAGDTALQTAVAAKADASTVTALTQTVNGKAEVSTVNAALAQKADTAALNALTQTVNGKADASTVNAALAQKADVTAMNTAIAACSHVSIGTYTGNGAETQLISLGYRPKAVLVWCLSGHQFRDMADGYYYHGGLVVDGTSVDWLTITNTGFQAVMKYRNQTNMDSKQYNYIAFR